MIHLKIISDQLNCNHIIFKMLKTKILSKMFLIGWNLRHEAGDYPLVILNLRRRNMN